MFEIEMTGKENTSYSSSSEAHLMFFAAVSNIKKSKSFRQVWLFCGDSTLLYFQTDYPKVTMVSGLPAQWQTWREYKKINKLP